MTHSLGWLAALDKKVCWFRPENFELPITSAELLTLANTAFEKAPTRRLLFLGSFTFTFI